jgi:formamidopyrimidine-DNA glycosylase
VLLMHLGMSGSFRVEARGPEAADLLAGDTLYYARGKDAAHDHVVLHLGDGTRVVYNDPRRFGFMLLSPRRPRYAPAARGTRPGADRQCAERRGLASPPALAGRAAQGRAARPDAQSPGSGNIYVCEALWRAGLSPLRAAGTLVRVDGRPPNGWSGSSRRCAP